MTRLHIASKAQVQPVICSSNTLPSSTLKGSLVCTSPGTLEQKGSLSRTTLESCSSSREPFFRSVQSSVTAKDVCQGGTVG